MRRRRPSACREAGPGSSRPRRRRAVGARQALRASRAALASRALASRRPMSSGSISRPTGTGAPCSLFTYGFKMTGIPVISVHLTEGPGPPSPPGKSSGQAHSGGHPDAHNCTGSAGCHDAARRVASTRLLSPYVATSCSYTGFRAWDG
eukprot:364808-Chlamydomonas_euryale.AAC.4